MAHQLKSQRSYPVNIDSFGIQYFLYVHTKNDGTEAPPPFQTTDHPESGKPDPLS